MDFIVKHPCTCILDNEPNVCDINYKDEKRSYKLKKNQKRYKIVKGSDSDLSWEKVLIKTIKVLVPDVNLTINRSSCKGELNIYVCAGSCVWLQGFDDVFPVINIHCEGKVTSMGYENNFVVGELTICMGPDYTNQSSVEGFQVVNKLVIPYQYNGIISGYSEQSCKIKYPRDECMGKCSRYFVSVIGKKKQREINAYRQSEGYHILTIGYEKNTNPMRHTNTTECINCNQKSTNLLWLSPCEHHICHDCLMEQYDSSNFHLKPPYFDCPNIVCRKEVMDLHRITNLN